jgi:hypothetical protein
MAIIMGMAWLTPVIAFLASGVSLRIREIACSMAPGEGLLLLVLGVVAIGHHHVVIHNGRPIARASTRPQGCRCLSRGYCDSHWRYRSRGVDCSCSGAVAAWLRLDVSVKAWRFGPQLRLVVGSNWRIRGNGDDRALRTLLSAVLHGGDGMGQRIYSSFNRRAASPLPIAMRQEHPVRSQDTASS